MNHVGLTSVLIHLRERRNALIEQLCHSARRLELLTQELELDRAIQLLEFCDRNRVDPNSKVTRIPSPRTVTPSSELRLIEDNETDDPQHWIEVLVDGLPIRPLPGAILIEPPQR